MGGSKGGDGALDGVGLGSGILLQSNETIALGAPAGAGNTRVVDGVIADQTGSGGKGCVSTWKKAPLGGVMGVQKGSLF